jgi:hypothetical protein
MKKAKDELVKNQDDLLKIHNYLLPGMIWMKSRDLDRNAVRVIPE